MRARLLVVIAVLLNILPPFRSRYLRRKYVVW
jgi:hypothetical protein